MNDAPVENARPVRKLRVVTDLPGPKSSALRARERTHLAPGAQAIASYAGIVVDSGDGSDLFDVDGNRFLDLSASICVASIGYGHPRFKKEIGRQLDAIHVGAFTTLARIEAMEAITALTPDGLDRVQFFSGG
jgi:4-aminobutyrate aminotransferase-like enzyme